MCASSEVSGETIPMRKLSSSELYLISTKIPCIDYVIESNKTAQILNVAWPVKTENLKT